MTTFSYESLPCGACGASPARPFGYRGGAAHHRGSGERTLIVRCRSCGHLRPLPMPVPRDLTELYGETEAYFQGHDPTRKIQAGRLRMRRLGRPGRCLDVGCGRGEVVKAALLEGWDAEGVDCSPEYVAWGKAKLGVSLRVGTLEEQGFPAASFDAVTLGAIIEHLYDPHAVLREVRRILCPGGSLWVDAPNEDGLYGRAGALYHKLQGRDWCVALAPTFPPYHVQGFNPRSLRVLLERSGFSVARLRVWGKVWPLTGERSLRKRLLYRAAQAVNGMGNLCGMGVYMEAWATPTPAGP